LKAVLIEEFGRTPKLREVPDPEPAADGVVIRVQASGLCRSDWHGWKGHDDDIRLPHVPGHEFAGEIEAVGSEVTGWRRGDRVTVPFSGGCGGCGPCREGLQNICDRYFQAGFTAWGSFAERVGVRYADTNLVRLPDGLAPETAAVLGCRFITAFRAVVDQGRVGPGEWLAVHGCGGVGLSAIMIGTAMGARVVGVDIHSGKLRAAELLGAAAVIDAAGCADVAGAIVEVTGGGAHVSIDALGSHATCRNSVLSLRKRGRHVQVGLLAGSEIDPPVPMGRVVALELEILGSHGMPAHRYDAVLGMVTAGRLRPAELIETTIALDQVPAALEAMGRFGGAGITVVDRF
jgi:alcohol dehydrogenase